MNVPDVANYNIVNELSSIILTPAEMEVVLKSHPVEKPSDLTVSVTRFFVNRLLNSHCHSVLYSTSLYRQVVSRLLEDI